MAAPPIPSAVVSLARQRGIATNAWHTLGKLDLRIDAHIRVKLHPGRRPNDVVLEARLGELPTLPQDCDTFLARVMLHVTAGAANQIGTIAVSADGRQLLLQAVISGEDADRFDAALETFLNELDRWLAVVRAEKS